MEVAADAEPLTVRTYPNRVSYLQKVLDMVKRVGVTFSRKRNDGPYFVVGCVMRA